MRYCKRYDNGLKVIINKIEGMYSVSAGIFVKTGSVNETEAENGISHFIEHVLFKGTKTRSAFEISDYIDRIGAQINAFTSKELTCYYTKSTTERLSESLEVLSDIFFNSTYEKTELEREKGVVVEEINMSEDTPEDLCFDLLAKSYYGKGGYGQTILGSAKNIKRFGLKDITDYRDKYYTADNVVISIAGNLDLKETEKLIKEYFLNNFTKTESAHQVEILPSVKQKLYKSKKIEQSHIGIAMQGMAINDRMSDAFSIANTVLGGGMSSRLFQKIREELGLAYSVYSYPSFYKTGGVLEIYAGVNTESRDLATEAIAEEVKKFKREGITEQEFLRAKEQLKSSTVFGRESTSSQMIIHGKYLAFLDEEFDYDKRIQRLEKVTIKDVHSAIERSFNIDDVATATVGPKRTPLKI